MRNICVRDVEFVQAVIPTARGCLWENFDAVEIRTRIINGADGCHVLTRATSQLNDSTLRWWMRTDLADDGSRLRCRYRSVVSVPATLNRIGLVVLLPSTLAGTDVTLTRRDRSSYRVQLPRAVAPQASRDGRPVGLFEPVASVRFRRGDKVCLISCGADAYEFEDERNWGGGAFKLYSPPLGADLPLALTPGEITDHVVVLHFATRRDRRLRHLPGAVSLGREHALPELGLTARSLERARTDRHLLASAHVRVQLSEFPSPEREVPLDALEVPMELVVALDHDTRLVAQEILDQVRPAAIRRIVLECSTHSAELLCQNVLNFRSAGYIGDILVAARDGYADLNRWASTSLAVALGSATGVAFSWHPLYHDVSPFAATDSLEGIASAVGTARHWGASSISVGPITFARAPPANRGRVAAIWGLMGGPWLVGAIGRLAAARVSAATIDLWPSGHRRPQRDRHRSAEAIFREISESGARRAMSCQTRSRSIHALCLLRSDGRRLLLGNSGSAAQTLRLSEDGPEIEIPAYACLRVDTEADRGGAAWMTPKEIL